MIELLTNDEMAKADRRTIASGTSGADLMEKAGAAVARAVLRRHPPGSRVAVVAGPGNNGGDGFVAARHLAAAGMRVRVSLIGARDRLKGDAAWAAAGWHGEVATSPDVSGAAVIIDALFGAGLDRPITRGRARRDRSDEQCRLPSCRGRPRERHQRHHGCGDGGRREGLREHHLLSQETGASPFAWSYLLWTGAGRRDRHQGLGPPCDQPDDFRELPGLVGRPVSRAGHRRAQIRARPCRRGVGRRFPHRGGPSCRDGGAARRCGPRHHRFPAERALSSTRRPSSR